MTSTVSKLDYTPQRRNYRAAWAGLQGLLKNKEDTGQVFRIVKALSGKSMLLQFRKFEATETGQEILRARRALITTLSDRAYLASLPRGSVGRHYLAFVEAEGITADGLVAASEEEPISLVDESVILYATRVRDMHDLWHVITGYGRDGLGESALVAFSYAQTRNLGLAAIAVLGAYKFSQMFPRRGVARAVWQGYRLGRQVEWLPGLDWEALLAEDIDTVRQALNIQTPTHYIAAGDVIAGTRLSAA